MSTDVELEALATAVADGTPVDWEAALTAAAGPDAAPRVAGLRLIARIAEVYRAADVPADDRPASRAAGSPQPQTSARLEPGTRWGTLIVQQCIGRGTFGDVYRAHDCRLDRPVALKLLKADVSSAGLGPEIVAEGRLLARVRHPNVVAVFGADRIEGRIGVWMELVEGLTLEEELLARGPFDPPETIRIAEALCRALHAVHAAGLLHRDVKTHNVMRDGRDGRIVLMDFSAGREVTAHGESDAPLPVTLAGSPIYLAPEVLAGGPASARSDLYSLGVLLFRLATGEFPVPGASIGEIAEAHAAGRRRRLIDARPNLPARLRDAIERALAADPEERFDSALDMERAMAEPQPVMVRSPRRTALAAATWLALAAAAAGALTFAGRPAAPERAAGARPVVLVGAFENRTPDAALGGLLEGAVREVIGASSAVSIAEPARLAEVLARMRQPSDVRIDARVGRELIARDGGMRALVVGSAATDRDTLSLSAELINPRDGAVLARLVEPAGAVGAAGAARRIAARLRDIVESTVPRLAPAGPPLEPVTTPSLQALQWYSQAASLLNGHVAPPQPHDFAAAEGLLRQALDEDPAFASAWLLLAQAIYARNLQARLHWPAVEEAVRLSSDVSESERLLILAVAHQHRALLTGAVAEFDAAVRTYETWLEREGFPADDIGVSGSPSPRHDVVPELERAHRILDRVAEADDLILRAAAALPNSMRLAAKVAQIELRRGNFAVSQTQALRVLAASQSDFPDRNISDVAWARLWDAHAAWLRGDAAGALAAVRDSERQWHETATRPRAGWAFHLHQAYQGLGWFGKAEEIIAPIGPQRYEQGVHVADDFRSRRDVALVAARAGDIARARQLLAPAETFDDLNQASMLLVWVGLLDKAEFVVSQQKARRIGPNWMLRAVSEGTLRVAQGRYSEGLQLLAPLTSSLRLGIASTWAREYAAVAHRARGDLAAAIGVLEPLERRAADNVMGSWTVHDWLQARVLLAETYRDAGRTADFERVASDVRTLLAAAPPGHPLLARLQAR